MSVHDPKPPPSTRIDRGWLMRHSGALADEALVRIANPLRRRRMGVFAAFDALAELVDASDPDLELSQLDHALQTAEAEQGA